jgi:hypothetical protein
MVDSRVASGLIQKYKHLANLGHLVCSGILKHQIGVLIILRSAPAVPKISPYRGSLENIKILMETLESFGTAKYEDIVRKNLHFPVCRIVSVPSI